ncbi:nitroreductase family protein [Candidatus Bathyarchaeota archaeon]|nr:nitroreductase family protein [Candidatus Bathyarchaeota archaeon]
MPDIFDVLAERRSVRSYTGEEVSEEHLNMILEAACCAPSAGNLQAYEIVVVRDLERRKLLAKASYNQDFMVEASVHLVFLAVPSRSAVRYGKRGEELYSLQDATIAATFAMLAAHALGYGTCWVGAFDDFRVMRVIEAPDDRRPVAIIVIGRGRKEEGITRRRKMSSFVFAERHGAPFEHKPTMAKLVRPGC